MERFPLYLGDKHEERNNRELLLITNVRGRITGKT